MNLIINFLKNIIAPPLCGSCKKFNTFLCPTCYEQLCFFDLPLSLKDIFEEVYLDSITAGVEYNTISRSIIHTIKYEGVYDLASTIGELLYTNVNIPSVDCIAPVPLHAKRQWVRGFNQSEAMAKGFAQIDTIPLFPLLVRTKHTIPQAQIQHKSERLMRLQGIFELSSSAQDKVLPQKVLLIDDVVTTGATLNECARILKQAGVKEVHGLAFAHGV